MVNWFKRSIAVIVLSIFSVQTLAAVHLQNAAPEKSQQSDNTAFFKAVISSTLLFSHTTTKNLTPENNAAKSIYVADLHWTVDKLLVANFADKAIFNRFNLIKNGILTTVNLIFPFQFFW